jgi:hypothetical protein
MPWPPASAAASSLKFSGTGRAWRVECKNSVPRDRLAGCQGSVPAVPPRTLCLFERGKAESATTAMSEWWPRRFPACRRDDCSESHSSLPQGERSVALWRKRDKDSQWRARCRTRRSNQGLASGQRALEGSTVCRCSVRREHDLDRQREQRPQPFRRSARAPRCSVATHAGSRGRDRSRRARRRRRPHADSRSRVSRDRLVVGQGDGRVSVANAHRRRRARAAWACRR